MRQPSTRRRHRAALVLQRPARVLFGVTLAVVAVGVPAAPAAAGPGSQQWYLDQIRVRDAHRITRGDGVTIGLITNGLPAGHRDLGDRVLPAMRLDRGLFDSIEQAPADYPVADTIATAEIGFMTAQGGPGLLGVAPAAKVRPIICPGLADDTNRCLHWLVDSGVEVIDFSQAQFDRLGPDFDGIRYALAHDVVVVMALHDGAQLPPQQRAGVVLVGGVDRTGELTEAVQPDDRVSLRAPGTSPTTSGQDSQIIGLDPAANDGSGYGPLFALDGDRIAAALVTAVVALQRSKYPDMTAPSVINRILRTATDRGDPGRDNTYGYGIVDAYAALTVPTPDVTRNPLGEPTPPASSWSNGRAVAVVATAALAALAGAAGLLTWRRRRCRRRRDLLTVALTGRPKA
jgi:membrane-anchored mycosin MYCP